MAVFLLVLLLHGLLIGALMRQREQFRAAKPESSEALLVYFLPHEGFSTSDVPRVENPALRRSGTLAMTLPGIAADTVVTPSVEALPPAPPIDWQHELELSAKNGVADEEREKAFRDLSRSMSPSQLDWLNQHHMEPARPGLTWKSPRVEVTKDGMPIVHINDHCVLVPLLFVPMVFCSIGHIEPNGDLFKHMRDPKTPQ